jgi:hypothetical protein
MADRRTIQTQFVSRLKTKMALRKLCWETMFGQELVKLTIMDTLFLLLSVLIGDFFRSTFLRYRHTFPVKQIKPIIMDALVLLSYLLAKTMVNWRPFTPTNFFSQPYFWLLLPLLQLFHTDPAVAGVFAVEVVPSPDGVAA